MLAIVAAFRQEIGGYLKEGDFRAVAQDGLLRFYESPSVSDVVVVEGGVGRSGAGEAATQVIERYQPDAVVSAGFAGGVRGGLKAGDLYVCDRLLSVEGPAVTWRAEDAVERPAGDTALVEQLSNTAGPRRQRYGVCGCLTVPALAWTKSMKEWIGSTFPVSIIDMESFWVGEKAAEREVPHLAVRTVLDPVEQTLPRFVARLVGERSWRRWPRAARELAIGPLETPRLFALASQAKIARAALAGFLADLRPSPGS